MKKILVTSCVALLTIFVVPSAYAASLNLSPATGSHNNSFMVDLTVDGGSQSFNAAQATVSISSNLHVTDLVYGNCNFSFLTIPSTANPSFTGVLLGSSSKNCTVYSMTLSPTATGQGRIALTNASIREYNTAKELLTSVQDGSYSLTGAQSVVTGSPTSAPTAESISDYTLQVKLVSDTNSPLTESQVVLTPQDASGGGGAVQVSTDANGVAQLDNIPPGVYKMAVREKNGEVVNERIITVAGNNRELTFGVKQEKKQGINPLFLVGGMIFGIILLVIGVWFFLHRRNNQA